MMVPWFTLFVWLIFTEFGKVAPQSSEYATLILLTPPVPVKLLHAMNTRAEGMVWVPGVPSGLVKLILHVLAPRGISTANQGLSRNCPDVPLLMTAALRYRIGSVGVRFVRLVFAVGSPFSRLLLSIKRATNTSLRAFVAGVRLKAIPL